LNYRGGGVIHVIELWGWGDLSGVTHFIELEDFSFKGVITA